MKVAVIDFSFKSELNDNITKVLSLHKVDYKVIAFLSDCQVIHELNSQKYTHVILRAPCDIDERKRICDELAFLLEEYTNLIVYPSLKELLPYENKRYLSALLKIKDIPHPLTKVFYDKEAATNYVDRCNYPIVQKSNIGASSSGVRIVKSKREALNGIKNAFGLFHPYLASGNAGSKNFFGLKIKEKGRAEKHSILFQEMISFKWEWRIIKICDVFLAYRKLKDNTGFASGSGCFGYGLPPLELLFKANDISKELDINDVAIDFFETDSGSFLVNEIQCLFGAKPIKNNLDSQMFDDDGNAVYLKLTDGDFKIISDDVCKFECWELRIKKLLGL